MTKLENSLIELGFDLLSDTGIEKWHQKTSSKVQVCITDRSQVSLFKYANTDRVWSDVEWQIHLYDVPDNLIFAIVALVS